MRFQHGAGAGAVDHAGDAALDIQAHVGVQRRAHCRRHFAEDGFAMLLDGVDQGLVAVQGGHGVGQQQALDVHAHGVFAGVAALGIEVFDGLGDHSTDAGFHFHRILFRNHAAVDLEHDLAGHHVGVGAAVDAADVQVGVLDAGHLRSDLLVLDVFAVQSSQQHGRGLQRVHTGVGHGGVSHLALHGDFHLQAAVVSGNYFVAEARCNHQVGLGQALFQQPAGAHDAAELFVVGVVQFHGALAGLGHGFQSTHGEGEGGEVALAYGSGAAIELAVFDLGAVGVLGPAFARRHHVAVGVQGDGAATVTVGAAHDQVGDGLHAIGLDVGFGHDVLLGVEAEAFDQLGSAFGVGCVVAGRRVRGHLHHGLQKLHFFVEVLVNPCIDGGVGGLLVLIHIGHCCS